MVQRRLEGSEQGTETDKLAEEVVAVEAAVVLERAFHQGSA